MTINLQVFLACIAAGLFVEYMTGEVKRWPQRVGVVMELALTSVALGMWITPADTVVALVVIATIRSGNLVAYVVASLVNVVAPSLIGYYYLNQNEGRKLRPGPTIKYLLRVLWEAYGKKSVRNGVSDQRYFDPGAERRRNSTARN